VETSNQSNPTAFLEVLQLCLDAFGWGGPARDGVNQVKLQKMKQKSRFEKYIGQLGEGQKHEKSGASVPGAAVLLSGRGWGTSARCVSHGTSSVDAEGEGGRRTDDFLQKGGEVFSIQAFSLVNLNSLV